MQTNTKKHGYERRKRAGYSKLKLKMTAEIKAVVDSLKLSEIISRGIELCERM